MSFRNLTTGFALVAFCSINLSAQSVVLRVASRGRNDTAGVLLYAKNKVGLAEIKSVLDDRRLVGYDPLVIGFDPTPENLDEAGRELSWQQDNSWAFYCLTLGGSKPIGTNLAIEY